MADPVTLRVDVAGKPGHPLEPVAAAVGEAANLAAKQTADFISQVNRGTGRSASSVKAVHVEGATSAKLVLDVPYGEWVRPPGQAPHKYTTMPILGEDALEQVLSRDDVAQAVADDLTRLLAEAYHG